MHNGSEIIKNNDILAFSFFKKLNWDLRYLRHPNNPNFGSANVFKGHNLKGYILVLVAFVVLLLAVDEIDMINAANNVKISDTDSQGVSGSLNNDTIFLNPGNYTVRIILAL